MTELQENSGAATTAKLTGKQARYLRGLGHGLKPVVQIGKHGVGESVESQVEECLLAHELIKVKVLETSPLGRDEVASRLVSSNGVAVAQKLGRTLLLYRPHPDHPAIELP